MTHGQGVCPRLRVRTARAEDSAAIRALLIALGYEDGGGPDLPALLHETLGRPDCGVFLACDRDDPRAAPLGLIGLSRRPQLQLGGTLVSIDTLAVLPEARGRGVGGRLLRRARAYARLHRAVRIEVHTSRVRENYRRGFYPAHGYCEADSALFRDESSVVSRQGLRGGVPTLRLAANLLTTDD